MLRIASIVEGHGECEAVPILIRRIAQALDPTARAPPSIQSSACQPRAWSNRAKSSAPSNSPPAKTAARAPSSSFSIRDDGCPRRRRPGLLQRAITARPDLPVSVVLAKREFEAWFLAAAESLRGQRGLPADLTGPPYPEAIRGAKEWLADRMPPGRGYSESSDQPALTALFDMDAARHSDSFDKCYREIVRLLTQFR